MTHITLKLGMMNDQNSRLTTCRVKTAQNVKHDLKDTPRRYGESDYVLRNPNIEANRRYDS